MLGSWFFLMGGPSIIAGSQLWPALADKLWRTPIALRDQINSEDSPCRSILSLGALGGAWIWIWEFVRRRRRRMEIWEAGEQIEFYRFPIGLEKNRFPNGLRHNGSKVSGAWAETPSFRTCFSRYWPPFMSKTHEGDWLGNLKCLSFPRTWE